MAPRCAKGEPGTSAPVPSAAKTGVEISGIFTDHMVMQRRMPVPVWGWAKPGQEITVSIDQQIKKAVADGSEKWMVKLDAMETAAPRQMTVKGKDGSLEIKDILLGEVWICGGQSNMVWSLKDAKDGDREIAAADFPEIRLFNMIVSGRNSGTLGIPSERVMVGMKGAVVVEKSWEVCSPQTVGGFSAVGFFFGRDLQTDLHVPIGLINTPVGGSYLEQWISRDAFLADPDLKVIPEYFDRMVDYALTPEGKKAVAAEALVHEAKQKEAKAQGKPPLWPKEYQAPRRDAFTSCLFNSHIHPLIPFAIRGVIWYQGESHRGTPKIGDYRDMFPLLIQDWRSRWGEGDFPFLYVQLPNCSEAESELTGWSLVREVQLKNLALPNTGMVVSIDSGLPQPTLHPIWKQPIGARLALLARALVYGEKIVYSGPLYSGMKVEGDSIRISFTQTGSGLEARSGVLKWFQISGADNKWTEASARIEGDTVVVHVDAVTAPIAVRYAWANNPEGCNLYNKEGLPASPFRSNEEPASEKGAYYKGKMREPVAIR